MNLYKFEVKSRFKSLLFWSIGILIMVGGGMGKYAGFNASTAELEMFVNQIPEVMLKILGFYGFDLSKAIGFYGIMMLYLNIMAAIYATILGTDLLSKEEKEHTAEFLMTKPLTRAEVVSFKILAGLTHMLFFNLITWLLSVIIVSWVAKGEPILLSITLILLGMFLLQLVFFSIGLLISAFDLTSRKATGVASFFMLGSFIMGYFTDVYESLKGFRYFIPFKYFDANTIIASQRLDGFYVVLSLAAAILALSLTYFSYQKRDLHL